MTQSRMTMGILEPAVNPREGDPSQSSGRQFIFRQDKIGNLKDS